MNFHQTLQTRVGVQVTARKAEAEIEVDTDVEVDTEVAAEAVVNKQSSSPLSKDLPVSQGRDSSVANVLFAWIPTVPATLQFVNKVPLLPLIKYIDGERHRREPELLWGGFLTDNPKPFQSNYMEVR